MFCRVVVSGDRVEVYQYSNGIRCGHERKFEIVRRDKTVVDHDDELVKRTDNLYRARQTVRRLVWANNTKKYTKFVTLTYAKAEFDMKRVKHDVKMFVKYLRRAGYEMNYLYVLEHQKKRGEKEGNEGSLHIHMLIFNDKKMPLSLLNKAWPHGSTDISALKDVDNIGAYVSKYITKESCAEFGSHVYGVSRGLKRAAEECFYTEGYSDTVYNGLHPQDVIKALNVEYKSQMRHDFRDDKGVGHAQIVNYYQGTWKDGNIIEVNRDVE